MPLKTQRPIEEHKESLEVTNSTTNENLDTKHFNLHLNNPNNNKELWETDQEVRKETLLIFSKRNFQKARKGVRPRNERKQSK